MIAISFPTSARPPSRWPSIPQMIFKQTGFPLIPTAVMVEENTVVLTTVRAKQAYSADVDIIFISKNGWSLGAPSSLESHAFSLYIDRWVSFIRRGETQATDICDYGPAEGGP